MFLINLCNQKFLSTSASDTPRRYINNINFNGFYYEQPRNKDIYSLELAVAQMPALEKYEVIFFENAEKTGIVVVFNKEVTRKSIFVEKVFFSTQANKLKNMYENIAIVKSSFYESNKDASFLKDIDIVKIDKIPYLYNPEREKKIARTYLFSAVFFIFLFLSSGFFMDSLNSKLVLIEQNNNSLENELSINNEKLRQLALPELPPVELRAAIINKSIEKIDRGEL